MYSLHRSLVLLEDTMLVFILYVLMEGLMESRWVDGVKELLELDLFL
jgi:hypothetical protein